MGRADELSPHGLYTWDSTIFDLFQIPEELDREVLLNNLMAETMELEVLYPNPTVFKNLVGIWSTKQLPIWERLYATTQYEYNPIENYNRYENSGGTSTQSGTDTHMDITTKTGQDVNVNETDTSHHIASFDSHASGDNDGLVKQYRDEGDSTSTTTYGNTLNNQGNYNYGKKITDSNEIHAHGNIGVTTTQKLVREQREVDKFNLYDIIIEEFKERFCVLVY